MTTVEQLIILILAFTTTELVGAFLFAKLRGLLGSPTTERDRLWKELMKGVFERIVLVTGLLQGLPQIIIAFGALKIGTRLKKDGSDGPSASNDFFLIGNLLSIFMALVVFWAITKCFTPPETVARVLRSLP